jgi:hypothetical protein
MKPAFSSAQIVVSGRPISIGLAGVWNFYLNYEMNCRIIELPFPTIWVAIFN